MDRIHPNTQERAERGGALIEVASASRPGHRHFVSPEGGGRCSCPGYQYGGDCRHLAQLRAEGVLPTPKSSSPYRVERTVDPWGTVVYSVVERRPGLTEVRADASGYVREHGIEERVVYRTISLGDAYEEMWAMEELFCGEAS